MSNGLECRYLVSLVIDEADAIIQNRSFAQDLKPLVLYFNGLRLPIQFLFFSATFSPQVLRFAKEIAPGAVLIQKASTELRLDTVHLVSRIW